jgi:hypothetical protein
MHFEEVESLIEDEVILEMTELLVVFWEVRYSSEEVATGEDKQFCESDTAVAFWRPLSGEETADAKTCSLLQTIDDADFIGVVIIIELALVIFDEDLR